jgi:hypothetical protein
MLRVSLQPIPIDFEWNECGVNVVVEVRLMDIERRRGMGPCHRPIVAWAAR